MDDYKLIFKTLWLNTMLLWWLLTLSVIILLFVMIDNFPAEALGFLLIGGSSYLKWKQLDKRIRCLIE